MNGNRNTRNPMQLRALIQNMGRSIDEARNRRLGPDTPATQGSPSQPEMRFGEQRAAAPVPQRPEPQRPGASGDSSPKSLGEPPVRSATEMFDGGTPRLKARPKRAS